MKHSLVENLAFAARAILLVIAADKVWRSMASGHGLRRAPSCALIFSAAVAIALLGLGDAALAQCNQVDANQTCTNSTLLTGGAFGLQDNGTTLNLTNTATGTISGTGAGTGTISGALAIATKNATVTNSGTISATGVGIQANLTVGTADVMNSGNISGRVVGISGNVVNVTNSGTISGGAGIRGLAASTLVNSGTIIGTAGTAIDFSSGNSDSLTFLSGSRIIGDILLGTSDTVNIRSGRDVAWLLTFGNGSAGLVGTGASVNVTGGAPFVISRNQVATLDPTAFGLADRSLMNVTGGISALVQNRFGGMAPVGSSAGVSSFAPAADKEAFNGIPSLAIAYAPETPSAFKAQPFAGAGITTVWTGAFGGVRHQSADGAMLGATDSALGAALGVDRQVAPDLKLGGFVGGGARRLAVDLNSQGVTTDYIFGGAYGRFDWASQFADFMLYGGHTSSNSSRTVANNLAPNGLETATAKYDGFFISPDVAYGWRLPVGSGYVLTPTARLRYVAGFFDGFGETGSAQNLSVGSRTIQDFEQRFELDLSRTMTVGANDTLKAGLHVGAIGLERVGDTTVNTVLLGQNLAFVTPGKADAFGGLAGTSFEFASHAHISVFGALEGIWMNDRSTTVTAKGGLRGAF